MDRNIYPSVVGVGHLCVDTLGVVDVYPEVNTSKRVESMEVQPGGGASQAMVAIARLGGDSGFIGNVGSDKNGDYLVKGLEDEHVDISCVERKEGISNFSFVCVSRLTGTRNMFNYHDKLPDIKFDAKKENYIAHAKYLHVDTTHQNNVYAACLIAHKHHVPVSMDASSMRPDNQLNLLLAKQADILITNELYPCKLMEDENKERALKEMAKWGQKIIMMTLGEKGSLTIIKGEPVYFPAYKIHCLDSTGAGDVFHGAFLQALLLGYDFQHAVQFSSAVSALKCQSLGGRKGIPTFEATLKFMEEHQFE